jgi:hypothetical protein
LFVSGLYIVVRRLLELIVLVGRSDRAKELEILVLRHELSILRPWGAQIRSRYKSRDSQRRPDLRTPRHPRCML